MIFITYYFKSNLTLQCPFATLTVALHDHTDIDMVLDILHIATILQPTTTTLQLPLIQLELFHLIRLLL